MSLNALFLRLIKDNSIQLSLILCEYNLKLYNSVIYPFEYICNCYFSTVLHNSCDSLPNSLGVGKEPCQLFVWGWILPRLGSITLLFCSRHIYVSG